MTLKNIFKKKLQNGNSCFWVVLRLLAGCAVPPCFSKDFLKEKKRCGWTRMASARSTDKVKERLVIKHVHHWRSVIHATALPAEDPVWANSEHH